MIRNKTIKFNLDKPEDRELWERMQGLPHGTFSMWTKSYWTRLLRFDGMTAAEIREAIEKEDQGK